MSGSFFGWADENTRAAGPIKEPACARGGAAVLSAERKRIAISGVLASVMGGHYTAAPC